MAGKVYIDTSSWDFNAISEQFKQMREGLSNEIIEYINRLCDIREFINCETYFHSKRQMILEDIHTYMDTVMLINSAINERKAVILGSVYDTVESSMRYKTKSEKEVFLNGDAQVARLQQFYDLFNSQIMFLNESKKTIEGVIFNMKYRIEIQKEINVC